MKRHALLLLTGLLAGCSILGGSEPLPLYTLKSQCVEHSPVFLDVLAVDVPLSEASLNTDRISVTPSPYRRDYLADGQWPDRLPKVLQEVFIESFSQRWGGAHVTRLSSGLQAQYILQSDIIDFSVENLEADKPKIHIKILMKLVDLQQRTILSSQLFEESICLESSSLQNIVGGFNSALHTSIDKSIAWLESLTLKRKPS
jgi:cholesterol transport system auxiliary component